MSTQMMEDVAAQIDELKELLGIATDASLAEELGLQKSAIAQWRRRNAIPQHVMLSLEKRRNKITPLPRGDLEEAFPAVVNMYALMVCMLIAPSIEVIDARESERKALLSELTDLASYFNEFRAGAALILMRIMRRENIEVDEAFEVLIRSPEQLAKVKSLVLDSV